MNRWGLRDTVMTVFMVLVVFLMILQMLQNDRLYDHVTAAMHQLNGLKEALSRMPGRSVRLARVATASKPATRLAGPRRDVGDWLIRSIQQPMNLSPILGTDAYSGIVNAYIFESLTERDNETLKFKPLLATKWEISEDKLRYRFFLDPRARWQDGKPVTADDVVFTYRTIMDPEVLCPHLKVYYKDIMDCQAVDRHTVEFTYRVRYWRALTFCGGMPILPRHIYAYKEAKEFNESKLNRAPVGSGPYLFNSWDTGVRIVLERNPRYWRTERLPALNRIVFRFFSNDTAEFQALKARQTDYSGLTPERWVRQTNDEAFTSEFRKIHYLADGYSYIGWNSARSFFSEKRCRRAMTHLVPRALILQKVMHGLGKVVTGNFNSKTGAYDHSIEPYTYDPKRAADLLEEVGWKDHDGDGVRDKEGTAFRFELLLPSGRENSRKIASILQEECRQVGIEMQIRMMEWAVFLEKIDQREFDAVMLGWGLPLEADPYQIWHSSQIKPPGHNFIGFRNKEADNIIVEARQEFDEAKRNRMFHRFHRIIHEEQPYTFLFVPEALVALQRRFANVKVYPTGLDPSEWYVPKRLQRY